MEGTIRGRPGPPRDFRWTVMRQEWRRLLFLHWSFPPDAVQATLPPGLEVDTHRGAAYVGIVPFFMESVRPVALPPVPGLSWFQELNVRTYVRDRYGRSGVWFYSLDANQALAVALARVLFGLMYYSARMSAVVDPEGAVVDYTCERKGTQAPPARYSYAPQGAEFHAAAGSLEEFLVERYRLFAWRARAGVLWTGTVKHRPYPLREARVPVWDDHPLGWCGFPSPGRAPDHILFSPGVNVRVQGIRQVP